MPLLSVKVDKVDTEFLDDMSETGHIEVSKGISLNVEEISSSFTNDINGIVEEDSFLFKKD